LPKESKVSLSIYNVVGQQIKRFDIGTKPAGYHQISWNDNALPNGVYIYQLKAGTFASTKKLMVVR
jgi:flagellar hook assembly protein FlgD